MTIGFASKYKQINNWIQKLKCKIFFPESLGQIHGCSLYMAKYSVSESMLVTRQAQARHSQGLGTIRLWERTCRWGSEAQRSSAPLGIGPFGPYGKGMGLQPQSQHFFCSKMELSYLVVNAAVSPFFVFAPIHLATIPQILLCRSPWNTFYMTSWRNPIPTGNGGFGLA